MITIKKVISHIKKCNKKGVRYNWLGFVENKDLSSEVKSLFAFDNGSYFGYDWVNGNDKLKELTRKAV